MKIATWNLERPETSSAKNLEIIKTIRQVDADILILTETNFVIDPGEKYTPLASDALPVPGEYKYTHGENETTIWSKYPLNRVKTSHPSIAVCAKVQTPNGDLNVYGTVIGILGPVGRKNDFLVDLKEQIEDWGKITGEQGNICIAGDFNVCWNGKYCPKAGRDEIDICFDELGISNLTRDIEGNIDHIAISNSFLKNAKYDTKPQTWNPKEESRKPKLSDHLGVCVTLEFPMSNAAATKLEKRN
jgi:exonuclease III